MIKSSEISIVTPSYNQGRFIANAIDSVLSQVNLDLNLQYVVMDKVSSDQTLEVLKKYQGRDDLTVVISEDEGQADAVNKGFKYTSGDILGWLNSDDILLPGSLAAVCKTFEDETIDVVYGDAYFIDKNLRILGKYPTSKIDQSLFHSTCILSQPSVFFRRSLFEKVGGLNTNLHYCLDYNLWIRFYKSGASFKYIRKTLSATRIHRNTKTAQGGDKFVNELIDMLKEELGCLPVVWSIYADYSQKKEYRKIFVPWKLLTSCFSAIVRSPASFPIIIRWFIHISKRKIKNTVRYGVFRKKI